MHINTHLLTDPSTSGAQYNRPAAAPASPTAAPATTAPAPAYDLARWQGQEGDATIPDSAGADQAAEFSQSNFLAQPGLALSAQANLNPDSVYSLLQT